MYMYKFITKSWVLKIPEVYMYGFCFFSVRLLSVLRCHSFFSSPPQRSMTSDFEGFSIPDIIHYIYFPILILEKERKYFPLYCSVLNKGTTGTIFIIWRGPWLGIEPRTSRTRSQHSTTRHYHTWLYVK